MNLYTKDGQPLQVAKQTVYTTCGRVLGRISGDRVFSPQGSYVGTIVNERLAYRAAHSAAMASPFIASHRAATVRAARAGSATWGDEPHLPERT